MARQRKPHGRSAMGLPMTPMIDVVFQLLVFFVVTLRPVDIHAHLDVNRPSGPGSPEIRVLRLEVYADRWMINGRPVSEEALAGFVRDMAELDPTQPVLILCSVGAPHERLVGVLDVCARYGLSNLSVVSGP